MGEHFRVPRGLPVYYAPGQFELARKDYTVRVAGRVVDDGEEYLAWFSHAHAHPFSKRAKLTDIALAYKRDRRP